VARRHDDAGLPGAYRRDRESPLQPAEHGGERLPQRLPGLDPLGEQVRHHLGVGLRVEPDAAPEELVLQLREVLDDAVVDHGHGAPAPDLGVGVLLARAAVGGPAGVPDAGPQAREVPVTGRDSPPEVLQPTDLPDGLYAAPLVQGEPRRVVTTILQML